MRHGERIDHVDKTWHLAAPVPFDPPLTPTGHEQAGKAAKYFKEKVIITKIFLQRLLIAGRLIFFDSSSSSSCSHTMRIGHQME